MCFENARKHRGQLIAGSHCNSYQFRIIVGEFRIYVSGLKLTKGYPKLIGIAVRMAELSLSHIDRMCRRYIETKDLNVHVHAHKKNELYSTQHGWTATE